jgi:hypothetical protein
VGITIHYKGNLQNVQMMPQFMEELIDISSTMKWPYYVLDEDWSKPSTAHLLTTGEQSVIAGDLALKGISIDLHPACESLSLFFTAEGILASPMTVIMYNEGEIAKSDMWNFIKTQFAPPDVHMSVVKLLKYLKKRYMPNLEVTDEGEFWDTEDKDLLVEKIRFLEEKMDSVCEILNEIDLDNTKPLSAEELGELLEERLKRGLL